MNMDMNMNMNMSHLAARLGLPVELVSESLGQSSCRPLPGNAGESAARWAVCRCRSRANPSQLAPAAPQRRSPLARRPVTRPARWFTRPSRALASAAASPSLFLPQPGLLACLPARFPFWFLSGATN
ncbi:hypothetical protein DTO212C5_5695 [Paecilomyces variotii]|nr:hypothetical protein DTO212C5_5695 [Paecilomyces variotii]